MKTFLRISQGGDQAAYVSPNRLKDAVITAKHLGIKTATTAWNSCTTANVNELAGKAGYIAGTTVSTVASVTGPLITSAATAASALAYGSGRLKESPTLNYSARKRVPPVPTLNPGPRAVDLAMTVALEDQLVPKRRTRLRKIQDKYMYDENDETLGEDISGNREGKVPEKKRGIGPAAPRKLSDAQLEDVPQVRSRRVQELDDVPLDASVAWQRKPINEVEANSRELFKQEWLAKGERSERRTEEEWVRRVR
jgi:hypothetical protein